MGYHNVGRNLRSNVRTISKSPSRKSLKTPTMTVRSVSSAHMVAPGVLLVNSCEAGCES